MNAVLDKPAIRRAVILNPQRMELAEQWRQEWVVNAEDGTTVEDILDMGYWAHMAARLQKFDHIEVRLETGEWIVNLIVTEVGRNWAAVHLASKIDLESVVAAPANSVKHEVVYGGPQHKFRVKRLADDAIIQSGIETKAAANAWLVQYETNVLKG